MSAICSWENHGTDFWELADCGSDFLELRSRFGRNNKEKLQEVRPEMAAHVGVGENTLKTYDQKRQLMLEWEKTR